MCLQQFFLPLSTTILSTKTKIIIKAIQKRFYSDKKENEDSQQQHQQGFKDEKNFSGVSIYLFCFTWKW